MSLENIPDLTHQDEAELVAGRHAFFSNPVFESMMNEVRQSKEQHQETSSLLEIEQDRTSWLEGKCRILEGEVAELQQILATVVTKFTSSTTAHQATIEAHNTAIELADHYRRRLEEASKQLMQDSLTGLATAKGFNEFDLPALKKRAEDGGRFTIVYLDLDNFKKINDQRGQQYGDTVISAAAQGIKLNLRDSDVIYRPKPSGDEFVIITDAEESDVESLLKRIHSVVTSLSDEAGTPLQVGVTAGTSLFSAEYNYITQLSEAEKNMQNRKNQRYREAGIERRK